MKKQVSVEKLKILSGKKIIEALSIIDKGAQGICFVVDCDNKLLGTLTDGDVRRALLENININEKVDIVLNKNYVYIEKKTEIKKIQELLGKYTYIPVLDEAHRLIDYASNSKYCNIPLAQPNLVGKELEYVTDCILSGWISSRGKYVNEFESKFGEYVENNNVVAVSNGTVALHLALITLGVGPGDEVIVPNLTFVAPVNAVIYVGALPVLVDVDIDTLAINVEGIKNSITKNTKAIIPVHLYGHPAAMDEIVKIANAHNLLIIEDCAEALGSKINNRHVGNQGDAAIFSFYGNKTITTGEGGVVIFKDERNFNKAKVLRDHGMSVSKRYWHEFIGYNYRITNIQAAIGVAQLERIDSLVEKKKYIAEEYSKHLSNIDGIQLPQEIGNVNNSYWLYTILLPKKCINNRDNIIEELDILGIEVRPIFYPVNTMPPYKYLNKVGEFYKNSDYISALGMSLPTTYDIADDQIQYVCDCLIDLIKKY